MICNEIYRGVIIWNRVGKIRNPQTGRKVPRVNPRSEWHRTEAPHLRIVPETSFGKKRPHALPRHRPAAL